MIAAWISGFVVGVIATAAGVLWIAALEDDPDDPHTVAATQKALDDERAHNERLELRIAELEQHEQGPAN